MTSNDGTGPFSPGSDPPMRNGILKPLVLVELNKVVAVRQGLSIPAGQRPEFRRRQLLEAAETACRFATFYTENKSDMLIERDEITIMSRMAHRDVFAIEVRDILTDAPINDGQSTNIAALAMRYELILPVRDPETGIVSIREFCEFGSMASRQEGFQHQKTCNAVRLLDAILYGERSMPLAATYFNNGRSSSNLVKKFFFREMDVICQELSVLRQHQLEQHNSGNRGARWFRPTMQSVLTLSDWINELRAAPIRLRSGRQDYADFSEYPAIQFKFGSGFLPEFFAMTEMISAIRPQTVRHLVTSCITILITILQTFSRKSTGARLS